VVQASACVCPHDLPILCQRHYDGCLTMSEKAGKSHDPLGPRPDSYQSRVPVLGDRFFLAVPRDG
jgi:hypothetical protein